MSDDGVAGQTIIIISTAAVVFDVTSTNLKGGTTNITTASGDITTWTFDGTNWYLQQFMDVSANMSSVVAAGNIAGSDTQLQYNNGGSFGGLSTLTWDDTDFLLGTGATTKLQFRDSGLFINSSTNGQLDIDADVTLELTAPTIELAGATLIDLQGDAIKFGEGGAADVAVTYNTDGNDGVMTWVDSGGEDYFQFSDDILMATTEKLQFRDTAIYLYSSADTQLDMVADAIIQVTAPTVNIEASTAITLESDSVTFGEAGDADIVLAFNANSADGQLKWMEDEDYFEFSDDILIAGTEKLQFYDTAIYINSDADGSAVFAADGQMALTSPKITQALALTTDPLAIAAYDADGEAHGTIIKYNPGTDPTTVVGQIYYLHTTGIWIAAQADAVATGGSQLLGIAMGTSPRTNGMLLNGIVHIPATEILGVPGSNASPGLPLYVSSAAAGHLTFTVPTSSGDFVRVIGYALQDKEIGGADDVLVYFNPDPTWIERS